MANSKQLMSLSPAELQALGLQSGLVFQDGMKKSAMVKSIMAHQASGWMDVNAQLMQGNGGGEEMPGFYGDDRHLSDAAHAAQMLAGAGFTETIHDVMGSGQLHHVEALNAYLERLGTNADDVWKHMPHANPNIPAGHWGQVNAYLRDTLTAHQDIMPEMPGHYAGDIMKEYSTNKGDVAGSYNSLASLYVDKSSYHDEGLYQSDVAKVASRLAHTMSSGFAEVAAVTAMGGKASYMDLLPQMGDPSVTRYVNHPREALNAAGLPLGSQGSAVGNRGHYSLSASLSGAPESRGGIGEGFYRSVADDVRSLAQSYRGGAEQGMNPYRHQTSDFDQIMDSATRYVGVEEARSGYSNLDDPRYSGSAIRQIVENNFDRMESGSINTFDPAEAARNFHEQIRQMPSTGTGFEAKFDQATDHNFARARRESKMIADLDASYAPPESPVTYHRDVQQGTQEWLDMRKNYDITGSTVGTLLGNGSYTTMQKKVTELEGHYASSRDTNSEFSQRMFARGHASEAAARPRVEQEYGISIEEVGAITNSNYPNMMYSPDGLIGDDALWEHKNPNVTKKFSNLLAGEHQDYMDQVQMGMHLSGRNRTLFSQTVGSETRSQWIDRDPEWYGRNKDQLDSIAGRRQAVRNYQEENQESFLSDMAGAVDEKEAGRIRNRYNRGAQNAAKGDASDFAEFGNSAPPPNPAPNTSPDASTDQMAQSVKTGIIAANEEMRAKAAASAGAGNNYGPNLLGGPEEDADFDDFANPRGPRGGGGGRGGNGGGGSGNAWNNQFGGLAGGSIAAGVAGGSVSSMNSGVLGALATTPWGRAATVAIGAVQIGNEVAEDLNDFLGNAQDAGVTNPNEYSTQVQGMEMLGLNQSQASRVTQTTHSAFNTLQNGDPSGAARITSATRGLITITDIQEAGGDSVALTRTLVERGRERGWSQAQIAGAAEMAGLGGIARAYQRSQLTHDDAAEVTQGGRESDTGQASRDLMGLQDERARILPGYAARQAALSHGAPVFATGRDAIIDARYGVGAVGDAVEAGYDLVTGTRQLESGGNVNARNPKSSAAGSMQTLDATVRDPGYGVQPAQNDSLEERDRVGRDYLTALTGHYGGDQRKAAAAYTDGPGTLDKAVKTYGDDWLNHMPQQAQKRVADLERMGVFGKNSGAGRFAPDGSGGPNQANTNIQLNVVVNGQTSKATVVSPTGQTTTQVVNTQLGNAMQRK